MCGVSGADNFGGGFWAWTCFLIGGSPKSSPKLDSAKISLLNFQGNNPWHAAAPSEQQSKHDLHNFPLHFVLLIVDPHFGPEEFLYSHRPELGREQVCP